MSKGTPQVRYAEIERTTRETTVRVVLDLDGGTRRDIATGIGFLDHMLNLMAFHGHVDLGVQAEGDLHIDDHHTAEDVGIVLGQALRAALTDSEPIERYGSFSMVMDEALVLVALDISGRGQLHFEADFVRPMLGGLATENIREFFRAFTQHAGITCHIRKLSGINDHHVAEAMFKGFGRALRQAVHRSTALGTSTKGMID